MFIFFFIIFDPNLTETQIRTRKQTQNLIRTQTLTQTQISTLEE